MSDEIIIQQLRDKELYLTNELNKVRLALKAFIDDNMGFGSSSYNYTDGKQFAGNIPSQFDKNLTYSSKILYVLSKSGQPMLVDEITTELHNLEPELSIDKLHKSVGHNVSMLAKYSRVKKHPYNRKIKYSL